MTKTEEIKRSIFLNEQGISLRREEIKNEKHVEENLLGIRRHKQLILELKGELKRLNGNQSPTT